MNITSKNGNKLRPNLFPTVVDEKGNVIADLSAYYNANGGALPHYLNASKEVLKELGATQGVQVVEGVMESGGKISVDTQKIPNGEKFGKILRSALTLGKIATTFLL